MNTISFTPAQIHILNMASRLKTKKSLQCLKEQLAAFYAKQLDEEMDSLWESGKWSEQKLQELKGAHFRTTYK